MSPTIGSRGHQELTRLGDGNRCLTDPERLKEVMGALGPVPADCDGRVFLDSGGRAYYRRAEAGNDKEKEEKHGVAHE